MGNVEEKKATGSCQCGGVAFRIVGSFARFFLCHCSRCRKDTGSAFAANLFSSTAEITWLSGQELIKTYKVPASRHQKSFCGRCGSAVPSMHEDGTMLVVPAGSLDSAVDMRPDAHICAASRTSWDQHLDDLPSFDCLPA